MNKQRLIWIAIIAIILCGGWAASKLEWNTNPKSYNLAPSEEMKQYDSITALFDKSDGKSSVIILLENTDKWNTRADFVLLDSLTATLGGQPQIEQVSGITNLQLPRKTWLGLRRKLFVPLSSDKAFERCTLAVNHLPI